MFMLRNISTILAKHPSSGWLMRTWAPKKVPSVSMGEGNASFRSKRFI